MAKSEKLQRVKTPQKAKPLKFGGLLWSAAKKYNIFNSLHLKQKENKTHRKTKPNKTPHKQKNIA